MHRKKWIAFGVAALMMLALGATALAAQPQPRGQAQTEEYPPCPWADCEKEDIHTHGRRAYCAHLEACTAEGCNALHAHEHDGVSYGPHHEERGQAARPARSDQPHGRGHGHH